MSVASSLDVLLTPRREGERLVATIPDGWQQGRGAFGGLVFGLQVRALEGAVDDGARTLRSLSSELFAPVLVGEVTLEPTVLRATSNLTTAEVRMLQGGELVGHAVGVFGKERPQMPSWRPTWAPPPAWDSVEPLPLGAPFAPVFTQHFEFRSVGPWPFMGAAVPEVSGWLRPRVPSHRRDAAWLAALIDGWWSAGAATFPAPRPFATVQFQLDVCAAAPSGDDERPLWLHATARVASEGYLFEDRELWSADGVLLARNRQVMVIIK